MKSTKMTTGVAQYFRDDILLNILSRLPPKQMGQFRSVSKHWNGLLWNPDCKTLRPSMICLSSRSIVRNPIHILDVEREGRVENLDRSRFNLPEDFRSWTIVGTFRGIVLLLVTHHDNKRIYMDARMILYNPFTGVFDLLYDPHTPFFCGDHAYGFGYGASETLEELKIVRFRSRGSAWNTCDVLNLKTREWSQPKLVIQDADFKDLIGTFLDGFLYWMDSSKIVTLNVDKMVISYIHLPDSAINKKNYLGTCRGRLLMITADETLNLNVLVMSEQEAGVDNSWSKLHSVAKGSIPNLHLYQVIAITEDGRIILCVSGYGVGRMIIYDTSNQSHITLPSPASNVTSGVEYQESLVSPRKICGV